MKNGASAWMVAAVLLLTGSWAAAGDAVVLRQDGCPIEITAYTAKYESEVRSGYGQHASRILHNIDFVSASDQKIVVVRFGITAFDALNEFMTKTAGWSSGALKPGKTKNVRFPQRPYAAFSFGRYGTGVVYVDAVRFEDGTIWRADMESVLEQLRQFADDLELDDLKERE